MRVALITTTIYKPEVLALYRAHDPDVMFFVAGDLKTSLETQQFCGEMDQCIYLSPELQKMHNYKSSELIGWNTDSRRNYALLEAMRWKADLIISIDDDMIPMSDLFFNSFTRLFQRVYVNDSQIEQVCKYSGIQLGIASQWFDAGDLTIPKAMQRGLPYDMRFYSTAAPVTNVEIGAAQGIILGIPDTDAATAITNKPFIHSATDILCNGFVVDPYANAVFNSQLTVFRSELAPAFAQFYFAQQRNTDIFASLLMRRIMREKNLYTYFGLPMAFHARQARPLLKDLQAERYGVDHIAEYADYLNRAPLPKDISVTEQCRILAKGWNGPELEAALAFYDDCDAVLA